MAAAAVRLPSGPVAANSMPSNRCSRKTFCLVTLPIVSASSIPRESECDICDFAAEPAVVLAISLAWAASSASVWLVARANHAAVCEVLSEHNASIRCSVPTTRHFAFLASCLAECIASRPFGEKGSSSLVSCGHRKPSPSSEAGLLLLLILMLLGYSCAAVENLFYVIDGTTILNNTLIVLFATSARYAPTTTLVRAPVLPDHPETP